MAPVKYSSPKVVTGGVAGAHSEMISEGYGRGITGSRLSGKGGESAKGPPQCLCVAYPHFQTWLNLKSWNQAVPARNGRPRDPACVARRPRILPLRSPVPDAEAPAFSLMPPTRRCILWRVFSTPARAIIALAQEGAQPPARSRRSTRRKGAREQNP